MIKTHRRSTMKKQTHLYFCMPRWAVRLQHLCSLLSVLLILIQMMMASSKFLSEEANRWINTGIISLMNMVIAMYFMRSSIDAKRVSRVEPEEGGL